MITNERAEHVDKVEGHPVIDVAMWRPFAADVAVAHYRAGYALQVRGDPTELERALGYPREDAVAAGVDGMAAMAGSRDDAVKSQSPEAARSSGSAQSSEAGARYVFGTRRTLFALGSDGSPARLDVMDDGESSALDVQIGRWLDGLRDGSEQALAFTAAPANIETGETSPPGNAWTKIGADTVAITGKAKYTAYTFEEAKDWSDAGVATATINVYRLNSTSSFDYYLVKTNLSTRAYYQREDRLACFYWTTHQAYHVTMSARTASGQDVQGRLFQAEPRSVPGSTDYKMTIGSELNGSVDKDGVKGGGKVTAAMETVWRVNDVNTVQATAGDKAGWNLEFPVILIRGIHDAAKGLTTTNYAIFEFPRTINDAGPPTVQVHSELRGAFATYRVKWAIVDDFAAHPYVLEGGLHRSFPVPQFGVSPQELTVRKDGIPAKVNIHASHGPLIVSWKVVDIPPSLQLSRTEGAGDVTLDVYATDKATPSPIPQLIRINTFPATATDSLRAGSIAVAVVIAE